ncbi:expressed unknown protein [Ectocarpus siliculosus]|uniref:Uncharacterized protein n=1 Tax=Ectocarpus siliculosus TaxID=2880 RepID=D7G5L5_ECTSI|nr:expressed unknown protein [Ectocarpus siliculosus]|eukprot:CBJ33861.1 expressed unknown protein [Ectocarpus siliculosus]
MALPGGGGGILVWLDIHLWMAAREYVCCCGCGFCLEAGGCAAESYPIFDDVISGERRRA